MVKTSRIPLFILVVLFFSHCTPHYARIESCDPILQALLVTETIMPSEWRQADGEPTMNDEFSYGAINHCSITFYSSNGTGFGVAHEQIFQYRNEQEAIADYPKMKELFSLEGYDSFIDSSHDLPNADAYYASCAKPRDKPMCNTVARYGIYIIEFNTHMSPRFMTEGDFIQVLQAIDTKMIQNP